MAGHLATDPRTDAPVARHPAESVGRAHGIALAVVFSILAATTVMSVLNAKLDSDEWQHLHVAWSWTKGEIPYRDVFDDHMPLFQAITAPLAEAVGERPSILTLMRLATLPILLLTLWATWAIGRRMLSPVMSLWAVAFLWATPGFLKYMLQYRPDGLWAALCTFAVLVLVGGNEWKRGFVGGFMLGLAGCVSIKTPVVLMSLVAAAVLLPALIPGLLRGRSIRHGAAFAGAFTVGIAVPFGVVAWPFMQRGLLRTMYYCVVEHNSIIGYGLMHPERYGILALVVAAGVVYARGRIRRRGMPVSNRFVFVALATVSLIVILASYALVPGQTKLALYPLAAIAFSGFVEFVTRRGRGVSAANRGSIPPTLWLPLATCAVGIVAVSAGSQPWRDHNAGYRNFLAEVLLLTTPADKVMDAKGETVFRDRAFFYAVDTGTITRLRKGLLEDNIPARCIAARVCVATIARSRFPRRAREFLDSEYIRAGFADVAGKLLTGSEGTVPFAIAVPADYAIVSENGSAAGALDGSPYAGARFLNAGRHTFEPSGGGGRYAVVWARAAEKGLSPFHPVPADMDN